MKPSYMAERPVTRRVELIEVCVLLFIILSWIGSSFLITAHLHLNFAAAAVSSIWTDLSLLSLVLYLVWRNGETLSEIGWTPQRWRQEVLGGLVLFLPVVIGVNLLETVLHSAGLSAPSRLPSFLKGTGVTGTLLALSLVIVVAVVEETVFRGYLILRLRTVTGRTATAVLVSSAVFSLGHGYEGAAGVLSVFVMGVVLALLYIWRGSLVAPVVLHFLVDFTSVVLAGGLTNR